MDNPENPTTQHTLDEEKQNKSKTQYVPNTTTSKQTQTIHESSYKQLEVNIHLVN